MKKSVKVLVVSMIAVLAMGSFGRIAEAKTKEQAPMLQLTSQPQSLLTLRLTPQTKTETSSDSIWIF